MFVNIKGKVLAKSLLIPLLVGGVSALLTNKAQNSFNETAVQPSFAPPSWLFPIVWSVLYVLMGISAYWIDETHTTSLKKAAFAAYYLQLAFNFIWSLIFFNLGAYRFAFMWIVILWCLILAEIILFHRIKPKAAFLQMPYLIWVGFAAVLNFFIANLN